MPVLGDKVLGDKVLGDKVLGDKVLGDKVLGDKVRLEDLRRRILPQYLGHNSASDGRRQSVRYFPLHSRDRMPKEKFLHSGRRTPQGEIMLCRSAVAIAFVLTAGLAALADLSLPPQPPPVTNPLGSGDERTRRLRA